AACPESLGDVGALDEEREHLLTGLLARERTEPHLEAGVGGVCGGDGESVRVVAGDTYGRAMQFVGDDAHVAAHGVAVEAHPRGTARRVRAGVVVHALAAHPITAPPRPGADDACGTRASTARAARWCRPAAPSTRRAPRRRAVG